MNSSSAMDLWIEAGSASFAMGFGLSASLIVAIGAQNAFVLRQGLRREHVLPIVGLCIALDVTLMAVGIFGLAGVAQLHPLMLKSLVLGGGAFLLAYGWMAARRAWSPGAMSVEPHSGTTHAPSSSATSRLGLVLTQTLALTLLNPHVYLDTVVLVGAVGARQAADVRWLFLAGAGLASAAWFLFLGVGARWLTPVFARPAAWRWLDAIVALTMWTLAVLLLLDLTDPQAPWAG